MSLPVFSHVPSQLAPGFEDILNGLDYPVLLTDPDGTIVWSNRASIKIFGVGIALRDIFPEAAASLLESTQTRRIHLTSAQDERFEAAIGRFDGDHLVLSLWPRDADKTLAASELDDLTGAAKRNALLQAVDDDIQAGLPFALHYLDLDRFKIINDTLGHGVGDNLLKKVAGRLKSACRSSDLIARIGGDEFVVLQREVTGLADAERLALRLVDLVGRTYVLNGQTINIGASAGFALGGERSQARDVLRDADLALYEAKRAGKGRYRAFEPNMSVPQRERRELEIDLRRALALRQFELQYQPFVELESNRVCGFEALLRWHHPQRGTVPPLEFIPMAEETGVIVKLGEWVLRTACDAAVLWEDDMTVAVNVSPIQFKADGLLETVRSALERSGLPAHRLEIEITESALLDNTDTVLATLHALRELGVKISMDDFGTGYSSLSYLQKFPFDKIKIDRSFVAGNSQDSQAILKAVAGLGASLGMAITAEGVETMAQLEHIRGHKCTHVQGYFTGRPMGSGAIGTFLRPNEQGPLDD